MVVRSARVTFTNCTSRRNHRDGFRIRSSPNLTFRRNDADDNGGVGLRISRSSPFATVGDVMADGNRASANTLRDVIVIRPNCRRQRCVRTTTTRPPGSTSTTVTTTSRPATTLTPTTTSPTQTTQPVQLPHFRLYVRIGQLGQSPRDVNVPFRSTDRPIVINIPSSHLSAFRMDDQVSALEIESLGGDTLQRFADAAAAYITSHASDYPGFTGVEDLHWAMRVQ